MKALTAQQELLLSEIRLLVERGTGVSITELKENNSEFKVFNIALKYVTTTKKTICKALSLNIDHCCRHKRTLEKSGLLVQSLEKKRCPFSGYQAHFLSTNPSVFEELTYSNQLSIF